MKKKEPPKMETKVAKYFINRHIKGMDKKNSQLDAGYAQGTHGLRIEATKGYKEIQEYYRDVLLQHMSLPELVKEHIKNIVQDQDKGAKNTAIKMALDKIEPENSPKKEAEVVVFKMKQA